MSMLFLVILIWGVLAIGIVIGWVLHYLLSNASPPEISLHEAEWLRRMAQDHMEDHNNRR